MAETDSDLVLRARDGDSDAFAELVARYRDAVYGCALHVLASPAEAAEAAQDAFYRAYRSLQQLRDAGKFAAWVCRIATNQARNRREHLRAAPAAASLSAMGDLPNPGPSEAESAEAAETRAFIRLLMRDLPDKQRLTFTLFHVDGYSHADLSRMLDVPVGTVKSRLSSARRRLREGVEDMAKRVMAQGKPDAEFWRSATATAAGRVASGATGEPIEGATVRFYEPQTGTFATVETGPDGRWEARDLIPGGHSISASHPDHVTQSYREPRRWQVRTSAVVRPGQTLRDIDFRLEPAGSIRGIVTNARGEPVADAEVTAWESIEPMGEVRFDRTAQARTDSDGRFAITALPQGSYLIGVLVGDHHLREYAHPATYHPGTLSLQDAEWVDVSPGAEPPELRIVLAERGSVRLTVRVVADETGEPIDGVYALVSRRDAFWDMFTGHTNADGVFTCDLLTPGPFQVTVGAAELGYACWAEWIDVAPDSAALEMEFRLAHGAPLSGRVVTADGAEPPPLGSFWCWAHPPRMEQIHGRPRRTSGEMYSWGYGLSWRTVSSEEGPQMERVEPDEEGHLCAAPIWPGSIEVSPSIHDKDWRVTGTSVGGRELAVGERFDCAAGTPIDTLVVTVSANLGIVAGRVVAEDDGGPLEAVWVDLRRRDNERLYAKRVETDRSGSFFFHSVPAGEYLLGTSLARDYETDEATRREVTVKAGGVVHLDLVAPAP